MKSAKPESHVVYASHLNQCSGTEASPARRGTSRSGRSRHRGSPTTRRRHRARCRVPRQAGASGWRGRRRRTTRRSPPSRPRRAARGKAGCPSPRRNPSAAPPAVDRDRDELLQARLEFVLARALDPLAQDRQDLRLRPPVDEDDEAEAELFLIGLIQLRELGKHGRIVLGALLRRRTRRQLAAGTDRRMRVEHFLLLLVAQRARELVRLAERVIELREPLDEARAAFEEPGEL